MRPETVCLETVITRLDKLEQHSRCVKRIGALLFILASSLLLVGALSSPPRIVGAEHFVLRDPGGKVRARLSTVGDSTVLSFQDHNGLIRSSLTVGDDGFPGLVFHDRHGEVRVFLGVVDGEPLLMLRDRQGKQRAMVKLRKEDGAPLLFVTDADGKTLWHAP